LYDQLHAEQLPTAEVWSRALEKLGIRVDYDADVLNSVPNDGPLVFVANHPFGVVDGLIMCHLISQVRKDFFLLVNESVMPQPLIEKHLLPIDFHPTKAALRNNLRTKRATTRRLRNGESLAIFPAGMVATADHPFGPAREKPWNTFVSRRIHEAECTVVPLYFHGHNSRLFQLASHVNTNIRLGLLMHEVRNKMGKRIRVEVGEPIPYRDLEPIRDAQEMINHLRSETLNLASPSRRQSLRRRFVMPLGKLRSRIRRKEMNTDLFISP
jgi:putative hemolysin